MAEMISLHTVDQGSFIHSRNDKWWLIPLIQAVFLICFIFYSMYVVLLGADSSKVSGTNYISPFYSPELPETGILKNWPDFLSPALILIWIPLGFRFTCYYARKVYHRAFLADPVACAVSELRTVDHKYGGETKIPYIISYFHRYFFYLAFILAVVHVFDFIHALSFGEELGLGIGSILIGLDTLFLALYVLSCHACKHIVGGGINCYSCSKAGDMRYNSWKFIKKINANHHTYFWLSLITLIIADVYIRLLNAGVVSLQFDRIF